MRDPATHPYATAVYAEVQSERPPLETPEWRGFVLRRSIETGAEDGAGPYPMTAFPAEADLEGGLERCRRAGLVSVVLVPDPLSISSERLAASFPVFRPFKTHYLIDPAAGPFSPTKHHGDRIRRGYRRCRIERVALADHLDEWKSLYAGLIRRHGVVGPAAFSDAYFEMLAAEPVIEAFAAYVGEAIAGMTLWFAFGGIVYNHLTASNALGYANGANFALYDAAIAHFSGHGVVNLGGGAGFAENDDGLTAFKRGFANSKVTAHICGAVLDPQAYAQLTAERPETPYFPAYRAPS